mgnify:CR=1 FL=1
MKIISTGRTNSDLEMDERIKKEAKTLKKLGHDPELVFLDRKNKSNSGNISSTISFRTISLLSRHVFPQGKFLVIKALEMHLKLIGVIMFKKWDVLWVHDHKSVGMIFFGWLAKKMFGKKLVWDQHELGPDNLLNKRLYHKLLDLCDVIIQANEERAQYLKKNTSSSTAEKIHVLENYPTIDSVKDPVSLDEKFNKWLDGSDYYLFQGGAYKHRRIFECIEAIYAFPEIKLVVLGPIKADVKNAILTRWPDYKSRIYITGWTLPKEFRSFTKEARASLIFYENLDINHWLCAPNRFYFALANEIPVICGPNPPMKRIVINKEVGIVCDSNGEDVKEIVDAIKKVDDTFSQYKENCNKTRQDYFWRTQEESIKEIITSSLQKY